MHETDQLVIHIHHVIVRQYKSSIESVSFEHLRICHRKGRTALKFFGHPSHTCRSRARPWEFNEMPCLHRSTITLTIQFDLSWYVEHDVN